MVNTFNIFFRSLNKINKMKLKIMLLFIICCFIYPCWAFVGKLLSQGKYLTIDLESRSLHLFNSVNSRARNWARPAFSCAPNESSLEHVCKCFSSFRFCFTLDNECISPMNAIISFMCSLKQSAAFVGIFKDYQIEIKSKLI